MKNIVSKFGKIIVGFLFACLWAANVQIGSGNSFSTNIKAQKAKAGNCPPGSDACSMYTFPDGSRYVEIGQAVVVVS